MEAILPPPNFIYFLGPKTTVAPSSDFVVSVFLDTFDPINAFDLEIVYDKSKLEFLNSDNTGSVVSIWQTSPAILENGNIGFSGGILKAFSGTEGLLIKLSFKATTVGEPKISFAKSKIYVADGKGTEIVAPTGGFTLLVKEGSSVISEPIIPFQETEADKIIKEGLDSYDRKVSSGSMFTFLTVFGAIIFVILAFAMYNILKRKL